jgi:hypothetical protein
VNRRKKKKTQRNLAAYATGRATAVRASSEGSLASIVMSKSTKSSFSESDMALEENVALTSVKTIDENEKKNATNKRTVIKKRKQKLCD